MMSLKLSMAIYFLPPFPFLPFLAFRFPFPSLLSVSPLLELLGVLVLTPSSSSLSSASPLPLSTWFCIPEGMVVADDASLTAVESFCRNSRFNRGSTRGFLDFNLRTSSLILELLFLKNKNEKKLIHFEMKPNQYIFTDLNAESIYSNRFFTHNFQAARVLGKIIIVP